MIIRGPTLGKQVCELLRDRIVTADFSFHEAIYRVSGTKRLIRVAQITTGLAAAYRRTTVLRLGTRYAPGVRTRDDTRREHQTILDALVRGEPDAVEQAARAHIQNAIDHLGRAEVEDVPVA